MMIGLNVGSGQRRFTSTPEIQWVNVDKVSRPGEEPDLCCDAAHLQFPSESVDYFVLCQVLEHFGCGEADGLIKEAYRVLKPGGSLLVSVPDMVALRHGWFTDRIDTQIYMTNVYGAYRGDEESRHKWGYSGGSLMTFLSACCPWSSTGYFDKRAVPGADLPHDWWILEAECVK